MTARRDEHYNALPHAKVRFRLDTMARQIFVTPDPDAKNQLAWVAVLQNLRAAHHLARTVVGWVTEDVVADAQMALHAALLYADPSKASVLKIARWEMIRSQQTQHGVHVPKHLRDAVYQQVRRDGPLTVSAINATLEHEGYRLLPLALTDAEAERIARLLRRPRTGGERPRMPDAEGVEPDLDGPDLAKLRAHLGTLPARTQDALLAGFREETMADVAVRYGCSREWIRQLHDKAFADLRTRFFPKSDPA